MESSKEQVAQLTDPSLLDKIDKLRELQVSEHIPLPQLVVVGDQSSGKSSVLEGLTDLPFPRDNGLCTRFATQIVFRRAKDSNISISIIPSQAADTKTKENLRAFRHSNLTSIPNDVFLQILNQACDTMGIAGPGQPAISGSSTFSKHVLKLELSGPDRQHLSVIDVPGIFRTPTEGLTTKDDVSLVRTMVKSYIKDPRTIILAVVPAPVDIATQEILSMAAEVDPQGQRTLGVLTKPDLVDEGSEQLVMELVRGGKNQLKLGYCIVRNRSQREKDTSSKDRHTTEAEFFTKAPWSALEGSRVGIPALQNRLRELLVDITRREFPKVKQEVDRRLTEREQQLKALGPARETDEQQRTFLLDLATNVQEITSQALDAYYNRNSLFKSKPFLRLATRISELNVAFSDDVANKGHTFQFNNSDRLVMNPPAVEPPFPAMSADALLEEEEEALSEGEPSSSSPTEESRIHEEQIISELADVIHPQWSCPDPIDEDIFKWIETEYNASRGFEIGTFDPCLLPIMFQEQSEKWDGLALNYISDVIRLVHRFTSELLSALCVDSHVRSNLWSLMTDGLISRYEKAMDHTRFILKVERHGTPLTTNHYFNDNLQTARSERIRSALQSEAVSITPDGVGRPQSMVRVNAAVSSVHMGNTQHTIEDIHAILNSYYKVARKRFVDVVCMQAAGHILVTGPDSPLRLFTPTFVHRLSLDNLHTIAGEDVVSKRTRKGLEKEIESLRAGRKVLRG